MTTAIHPSAAQKGHQNRTAESMQLVSFRLAQEEYGIEITKVQEIILPGEITARSAHAGLRQGIDQPAQRGDSGRRSAAPLRPAGAGIDRRDAHHGRQRPRQDAGDDRRRGERGLAGLRRTRSSRRRPPWPGSGTSISPDW